MKVAVIGCGTIANAAHIPSYMNNPEAEIKYFCDIIPERAEAAVEKYGCGTAITDYHIALNDPEIEAVSVCTPNNMHPTISIDAMRAGKHVYLDKPVAVTAEAAERMLRVQRETGVKCQVVLNNRFFPSTMRAHQLIEEGRLGEILSFTCRYLHSGSVDPNRAMGWKQGLEGGGFRSPPSRCPSHPYRSRPSC